MPLKDDWVTGNSFTAADQNVLEEAVKAVAAYAVDAYGADPTGGSYSDTAFAAAITAMGNDPGVLVLGAGHYKLASTKTLAYPGQGIIGQGHWASYIDYYGTGDCLRVYDSTVSGTAPGIAGPVRGFGIYGWSNANTNITGLHLGDLMAPDVDVLIEGFGTAGAKGFHGENVNSWCEHGTLRVNARYCTTGSFFESGSWSYNDLDLFIIAPSDADGVSFGDDLGAFGVTLLIRGNFLSGVGSNTGVAFKVGATTTLRGSVQVTVEANGTGVGHTDVTVGSGSTIEGVGVIDFYDNFGAGDTAVFQTGTATASNFRIAGRIINFRSLAGTAEVAVAPAVYDSFTAADSTALDSGKWTVTTGGAGAAAATTNSNRARLTTGATGGYSANDRVSVESTLATSLADAEILVRHTWGAVAVESYHYYALRATSNNPQAGSNYQLVTTAFSTPRIDLLKVVSASGTTLTSIPFSSIGLAAPVDGGVKWIRFRVKGTTVAFRVWDDGEVEPISWTYTTTDSSVTAGGKVVAALFGGSAAASGVNYVDQFHIYAL